MEKQTTYPHVNWTDGMKLNKDIFIAQDNAQTFELYNLLSSTLSPIRYGIFPGENNFNIQLAIDNQNTLRINLISCKAVSIGGVFMNINATDKSDHQDGNPFVSLTLPASANDVCWVVLTTQPYDKEPFGNINPAENPPRFPYAKPSHQFQIIAAHEFNQYAHNPYALVIGKLEPTGGTLKVAEDYLPPFLTVNASQDLLGLHSELDSFLANLEQASSQIVQKIYKKASKTNWQS
ncbi:hypothetical protein [Niabella ginsengisoli]|uniref:Uncharacterized protein n=1 Tax=Niabella ginsengisoli TaxID=522298 RepID=A0ABS9SGR0_9BACT|nr:hypothetical protein [Niabella ginsengisoli]MCH5597548.1 hypothetical protein [Niabella ginsengisoli]